MKKLKLLIAVILLTSCGRQKGKIESALAKEIEQCNTASCTIKLAKITEFKWDKVYFFEMPVSKEYINKSIGTEYTNFVEFTRPIIFLNNGKMVYSENNEASIERLLDEQIVIGDIIDTNKVRMFTPKNAIFKSLVKENNNLKYYELIPLKNN